MPDLALEGVRVLDLSRGIAGAYAGKLLADFGADVVKVEPPQGDPVRRLGPFPEDLPDPEAAGRFLFLNTNKRSLTLDLGVRSGQVVIRRLLPNADVVIEDFAPGTMASWGLSYIDLAADFPRLVYASISAFGQTGPYRDYKANGFIAFAMSGAMQPRADLSGMPPAVDGEVAENFAGLQAWVGILAALAHREQTGEGQHVDVSLVETMAAIGARDRAPGPQQLLEDEGLDGFWQTTEHPRAGVLRLPGPLFAMSETPARSGRAPLQGEHSAAVLTTEAGYELSDLTILSDRSVI